ncbi:MAG: chorismate mutase [Spirochaetia bacterium]
MTKAARGAIQVVQNERQSIYSAARRLVAEMLSVNMIRREDIVSIMFSLTIDLDAGNPATGLREKEFQETPLFCVQEARVEGGVPRIIRALITFESLPARKVKAVYLDGAEALRPDLATGRPS